MVEKERRPSGQPSDSIPRGKAQKAAPERRKGYFYLWLAAWWPTTRGAQKAHQKRRRKAFRGVQRKRNLRRKRA